MIVKSDYVTITKYLPPRDRHKRDMRNKRIKDILYILVCSLVMTGFLHKIENSIKISWIQPVNAQNRVIVKDTKIIKEYIKDDRANKLQSFLTSKGSPFANMATYIVEVSDKAGIDWTLLTAISGKESGYGVAGRCFNAWGLGGRSFMCFNSWKESIAFEANLLGESYRANAVGGIQGKYCPTYECASDWTNFVVNASQEILVSK